MGGAPRADPRQRGLDRGGGRVGGGDLSAILAKFFGLSLFAALTSLLCFGVAGWPLACCVALGLAANAEVVAIAFILREWQADVPTWRQALRLRRGLPVQKWSLFN